MVLDSYIFVEDHERSENYREKRKRTYLYGILILLIGLIFMVIEYYLIGIVFFMISSIVTYFGKIILLRTPSKGTKIGLFHINKTTINILGKEYKYEDMDNLKFILDNYLNGPSHSQLYKSEGNQNVVSFCHNDNEYSFKFFIGSSAQYKSLIEFLKERNIQFSDSLKWHPLK